MSDLLEQKHSSISNLSDFVQIKDEQVYTTSRIVAEKFGKEHKHVIRDIEELIKNMVQPIENINQPKFGLVKNDITSVQFTGRNFPPSENIRERNFPFSEYFISDSYIDAKGETRKQYIITEKGAMLLIMGFTGEKAFAIKTKFIDEFARMKNIINNPASVIAETGSADAIVAFGLANQRFVNAWLEENRQKQLVTKQRDLYLNVLDEIKETLKEKWPKADFYDKYMNAKGLISVGNAAKILTGGKIGRNKFFKVLRDLNIVDSKNIPYQKYIGKNYFKVKTFSNESLNKSLLQTYLTSDGMAYLNKKLNKEGII